MIDYTNEICLHSPFLHSKPLEQAQFDEQKPPRFPELTGQLNFKKKCRIMLLIYKLWYLQSPFWQTKPPEHKQLDEQKLDRRPEFAGHLDFK